MKRQYVSGLKYPDDNSALGNYSKLYDYLIRVMNHYWIKNLIAISNQMR